jgi:hypothetical protein
MRDGVKVGILWLVFVAAAIGERLNAASFTTPIVFAGVLVLALVAIKQQVQRHA